jgi:hypothetical protein
MSNPRAVLESLRWDADMIIENPFGERVWLKESYVDGKRVGITDCCPEEYPCEWHSAFRRTTVK